MHAGIEDRNILTRIIVLLLALAGLANDAARLPYTVRVVMLYILRRAEPFGRRAVAREATLVQTAPWLVSSAEAHGGNAPAAALSLASCFRLLALALANAVLLSRRFAYRASLLDARHILECINISVRPAVSLTLASVSLDSS